MQKPASSRSLAIMAVAITMFIGGCGPKPVIEQSKKKPIGDLTTPTIVVGLKRWQKVVQCQGELRADEMVAIGMRVAGRVAKVHVDLGDRVSAGDPLVSLDPEEFQLLVAQAEAQLAQTRSAVGLAPDAAVESLNPENSPPVRQERAVWNETKSSLERAAQLRKQNAIADGEYDLIAVAERVAEARYASALNGTREKLALIGVRQAELSLARQRLADAVVKAPFDGFIQQRAVAPGAYVTVGAPLLSMVRTNPLWFRGTLPERVAGELREGLSIRVNLQSSKEPIDATITRVSPALDSQSRSLVFEARIENSDNQFRTGLFAEAEVVLDPEAQLIVVPSAAVTQFAGAEKVWKVIDGISSQHEIIAGATRDGFVEVIEGLVVGDVLLADGENGRVARIIAPTDSLPKDDATTKPVHAMIDSLSPVPEG